MSRSRNDLFSRLFVESRGALGRYVRRLVRSPEVAEEIVQETFLRAYEHAEADRPAGPLLYSIAHNLAIDHHRHGRLVQRDAVGVSAASDVIQGDGASLESWLLEEEQSAMLKDAVERLPPQCRAAFALKIFHDLSYKDIAVRLGISVKTVEIHVSRGIRDTYRFVRQRYQDRAPGNDHE